MIATDFWDMIYDSTATPDYLSNSKSELCSCVDSTANIFMQIIRTKL